MKKQSLLILPLILSMAACSKSSSDPAPQNIIPNSLAFTKPAAGPELTGTQVDEMKATLKTKSMMTLPPGELVFPDENMSPEERQAKEQQLKYMDPNAYALMMEARGNCGKGHPNLKFDATFPMDQVTEQNAFDILQAGDHVTYSGSAAMTNRGACPVDAGASFGMNGEVKDVKSDERSASAGAGVGGKLKFVMKNAKYANLLGTRGIIVDTNISGLAMHREVGGLKESGLMTYTLSGSYLSLKADIPYSIDYKILVHKEGETITSSEMTFTAALKYPTFTATLIGYAKGAGDKMQTQEFYLNGRQVTPEELRKIFGDNLPGEASQNSIRKALLN